MRLNDDFWHGLQPPPPNPSSQQNAKRTESLFRRTLPSASCKPDAGRREWGPLGAGRLGLRDSGEWDRLLGGRFVLRTANRPLLANPVGGCGHPRRPERREEQENEISFPALAMEVALAISAALGPTTLCKRWLSHDFTRSAASSLHVRDSEIEMANYCMITFHVASLFWLKTTLGTQKKHQRASDYVG